MKEYGYKYKAIDSSGKEIEGETNAVSYQHVKDKMKAMDYLPVRINRIGITGVIYAFIRRHDSYIIVGAILLFVIMAIVGGIVGPPPGPLILRDGSVFGVTNYLRKNLNDPRSYEPIEWSKVAKSDLPAWGYVVRHKYRAKNMFGGYIIKNEIFYLNSQGQVGAVVDDFDDFTK